MPNALPNHWRARTSLQPPTNGPALPWQAPPPFPPATPYFAHLPWGYADPLSQKPSILRDPPPGLLYNFPPHGPAYYPSPSLPSPPPPFFWAPAPTPPDPKDRTRFPPGLRRGTSILSSDKHCLCQHVLSESAPWLPENRGKALAFQMKYLDCHWGVRAAMDVLRPGEDNSAWAVMEAVERGGGSAPRGGRCRMRARRGRWGLRRWGGRRGGLLGLLDYGGGGGVIIMLATD
ncbi:hypothetical protein V2W45_1342883 [Cenococcum geophilum]